MDLTQLRYVRAVIKAGSFTSAAAECHVQRGKLSLGIERLEEELGERLFIRTTTRLELTAFGAYILPSVDEVVAAASRMLDRSEAFMRSARRSIRIGTAPLMNAALLNCVVEEFQRNNSDIEITVRKINPALAASLLGSGALDYVFGLVDTRRVQWRVVTLYSEPLLFIPQGASWLNGARPKFVQLDDIRNETFIVVSDHFGLAQATRNLFRQHRYVLHEHSHITSNYSTVERCAESNLAAAILPRSKLKSTLEVATPIMGKRGEERRIRVEALWIPSRISTSHLLKFQQHLREWCRHFSSDIG